MSKEADTWSLRQDAQVGQRNGRLVKALKKQQSVPGWDGSVWTRTGVPALGTGDMTTQREGKHCALQSHKESDQVRDWVVTRGSASANAPWNAGATQKKDENPQSRQN